MSRKYSVLQTSAEAKGAQPVFVIWKSAKNRPREQKMQYFADIGGGEGGLSPLLRSVNGQNTIKKNQNS